MGTVQFVAGIKEKSWRVAFTTKSHDQENDSDSTRVDGDVAEACVKTLSFKIIAVQIIQTASTACTETIIKQNVLIQYLSSKKYRN